MYTYTLRPWRLSDAPALFSWASDPTCAQPAGWTPLEDEEAARMLIARHFLLRKDCWAVADEKDRAVGAVALRQREGQLYLSYILSPALWGRGLLAPLLLELLAGRGTVRLTVSPENLRSKGLAGKLGFSPVGREGNMELWERRDRD